MACAIEDTLEGGGGWGGMTFLTPLGHTCTCSSFPTHTPVRVRITRPGVAARSRASRGEASTLTSSGHLLCNFLGMSIYEQRRQLAMSRGLERACAGAFRARGDKSPAGPALGLGPQWQPGIGVALAIGIAGTSEMANRGGLGASRDWVR